MINMSFILPKTWNRVLCCTHQSFFPPSYTREKGETKKMETEKEPRMNCLQLHSYLSAAISMDRHKMTPTTSDWTKLSRPHFSSQCNSSGAGIHPTEVITEWRRPSLEVGSSGCRRAVAVSNPHLERYLLCRWSF